MNWGRWFGGGGAAAASQHAQRNDTNNRRRTRQRDDGQRVQSQHHQPTRRQAGRTHSPKMAPRTKSRTNNSSPQPHLHGKIQKSSYNKINDNNDKSTDENPRWGLLDKTREIMQNLRRTDVDAAADKTSKEELNDLRQQKSRGEDVNEDRLNFLDLLSRRRNNAGNDASSEGNTNDSLSEGERIASRRRSIILSDFFEKQEQDSKEEESDLLNLHKQMQEKGMSPEITFNDESSDHLSVSMMSLGDDSYLGDLCGQRARLDQDFHEETLEEALELYERMLKERNLPENEKLFFILFKQVRERMRPDMVERGDVLDARIKKALTKMQQQHKKQQQQQYMDSLLENDKDESDEEAEENDRLMSPIGLQEASLPSYKSKGTGSKCSSTVNMDEDGWASSHTDDESDNEKSDSQEFDPNSSPTSSSVQMRQDSGNEEDELMNLLEKKYAGEYYDRDRLDYLELRARERRGEFLTEDEINRLHPSPDNDGSSHPSELHDSVMETKASTNHQRSEGEELLSDAERGELEKTFEAEDENELMILLEKKYAGVAFDYDRLYHLDLVARERRGDFLTFDEEKEVSIFKENRIRERISNQ